MLPRPSILRLCTRARLCAGVVFIAEALGVALLGGCGGGGGGGPAGPPPTPAIVAVAPEEVWRDEASTVTITGTDTGWSAAAPPSVLFGSDVVVESVEVDSPTSIRVRVHPAYDAAIGLRVPFVSAGATFYAGPFFEVKAPVSPSFFSQPFVRSSVLVGVVNASHPDLSINGPVVAVASDGTLLPLFLDDPHGFIVVIPEDAPLGRFDLLVPILTPSGPTTTRVPAGPILPRSTVLTSFPSQVTLPTADGTALHRYIANAPCYLEFPMTSSDPSLPVHFLYPHESPFAPPIVGLAPTLYGADAPGPRAVALPGETFDIVVFAGHTTYGMSAIESSAPLVAETEPNNAAATAQTLALPAIVHPATLDAATGPDVFQFAAGPGDIGKRVRVVTTSGPAMSIGVIRADGATVLGGGSASSSGAAVDLRSQPIPAAETIYLLVTSTATPSSPDVTSAYRMFVRLESP